LRSAAIATPTETNSLGDARHEVKRPAALARFEFGDMRLQSGAPPG
jgi:hypothetical protein